ncbi:MAG: prephenate dehydratase [Solirubrobacteraceae bacterium]|jgi:prephenate dehydratase|nr:prephenate dehydratase [Solirubrobacteraceae bacterium]
MRAAFLGPEGTYSHAALLADSRAADWEAVPAPTVFDAVAAVEEGVVDRALVPIENSTEGAVGPTLDALAVETEDVRIIGEVVHPIRHAVIAREALELSEVEAVLSHPQANAQCARFVRSAMPQAGVVAVASTAEAVRIVVASDEPAVALGPALAAEIHGGVVLRDGVEDTADNETRFVWLAPAGTAAMGPAVKTSVVWWGEGDESAGWLVRCLSEFAFRGVNLTRIESRPRRLGLGHYMFFADLDGAAAPGDGSPVTEAIEALATHAETVRVLGSY